MHVLKAIFWREFTSYFATPLAYIFIVVFLLLSGALTFFLGGFLPRGQADLQAFFMFHPWLYLFFVPAVTMRLWAEERKLGTVEFLMTLPVKAWQACLGKFLACWVFVGLSLLLTFPLWLTVNYLGQPDNGVIFVSYLSSWLMAGGLIALGCCCSALTKNQVIAFVLAASFSLIFMLGGTPVVLDFFRGWTPDAFLDAVAAISVLTHFQTMAKGLLQLKDIMFFIMMMVFFLAATMVTIESKKAV